MLGFCHLFAGIVLGILIYKKTGERIAVLACGLGSLLPDLIDKPLGHWILSDTLNSGRIYAHTLVFMLIIACIGVYYWKKRANVSILAAGGGVAVHLALDEIWQSPVTVFWPLLGSFTPADFESYFTTFATYELTSPSEWMFAFAVLYALVVVYYDKKIFSKIENVMKRFGMLPQLLLIIAGIAYVMYAIYANSNEYLLIGLTATAGGVVLLYNLRCKPVDSISSIISEPPDDLQ